uniref:Uncharacterized protein n=1 Tax=Lepeophtheirus salmonis TaxID=72036 RepID=A0A0K2TCR8_LEPSM
MLCHKLQEWNRQSKIFGSNRLKISVDRIILLL